MDFAHKLVSTRRGTLLLSLLAAVVAGALIVAYVSQYRNSVNEGSGPVTVLVARTAIAQGTPGKLIAANGLFTVSTVTQSRLREGAFSDPASLAGRVATHDIYQGQQLTASDFAGASATLASSLSGHERVVAIPIDSAHGLIGDIHEGDRVDIYVGFNVQPVTASGAPTGAMTRPVLRLAMQDVKVISVASSGSGVNQASSSEVALQVTDRQAADLAFASDNGKVWLSLRPAVDAAASSPDLVSAETLLLGIPPVSVLRSLGGRG